MHHAQQNCEKFWTQTYQDMQVIDRRLSRGSDIVEGLHPVGGFTIAIQGTGETVDIISERRLDQLRCDNLA